MKLDPDCVRSVLLTIEEHMSYDANSFNIGRYTCPEFGRLFYYDWPKVRYHIKKCEESGYISVAKYTNDAVWIKDMTANGHRFLADIRTEDNWRKAKSVASKLGSLSLSAIEAAAKGFGEGVAEVGIDHFFK